MFQQRLAFANVGLNVHVLQFNFAQRFLLVDLLFHQLEFVGLVAFVLEIIHNLGQEAGAETENTTDTPAADTGSDENKEG